MGNMTATVGRPPIEAHFGENTFEAIRQAALASAARDEAQSAAADSAESASFAEEFSGPAYADIAAGEAATTTGQFFRVPVPATDPVEYTRYQRTSGGSVEAAPLATTVALAASGGAEMIGTPDDDLQTNLNSRVVHVTTRTEMKALNTTRYKACLLRDGGRSGTFELKTGTPPTDTLEGIYVVSDTAGSYWERVYSGFPSAIWWGAELDNGVYDSYPALQACLDITGQLWLPKGRYYGSGELDGGNKVIRGEGRQLAGYVCTSATSHILKAAGSGSAFVDSCDWEDFFVARSVTPTTPVDPDDDLTQGHGIHVDLVSNARIRNVDTYDNLIELYIARTLTMKVQGVRGIRLTGGGAGTRWRGTYVNGDQTGMVGSYPSPNPSCTIEQINMVARPEVDFSVGFDLQGDLQDLWMDALESGGFAHIPFRINPNGGTAGDVKLGRLIADGYRTYGFHILNVPQGSSLRIADGWVAPTSGATGAGVRIQNSNGVEFHGSGDFSLAPTIDGVYATDGAQHDICVRMKNCQRPIYTISVSDSKLEAHGVNTIDGTDAGYLINVVGGSGNTTKASGRVTGTKQWIDGIAFDGSTANNFVDVTGVNASAVSGGRYSVSGTPVTTQGNVNGHVVINPGAGEIL